MEAVSVAAYCRETSLDSLRILSTRSRVPEIGKIKTGRHQPYELQVDLQGVRITDPVLTEGVEHGSKFSQRVLL